MKVLIVKMSSMGDLIHTFPALSDAKAVYPEIQFDWVVEEAFLEMPKWHIAVCKVIPIALRRWRKQLFKKETKQEAQVFVNALRAEQYDFVIDPQGLLKSALVACIAKGKRVGFCRHSARERLASILYEKHHQTPFKTHIVSRIRGLFATALDYPLPTTPAQFGLNLSQLPRIDALPKASFLVFLHGTSRVSKEWPEDRWLALANLATKAGFAVCVPWGNEREFDRAQRMATQNKGVSVLSRLTLSEMAYVLSQATGVVALDSGFAHLVAILEKPILTLYKASSPEFLCITSKRQLYLEVQHESYCEHSKTKKPSVRKNCACFEPLTSDYVWNTFIEVIKS